MSQESGTMLVTLPNSDEMLARLRKVDDTANAMTHLHPLLIQYLAGKRLETRMVVTLLSMILLEGSRRCRFELTSVYGDNYGSFLEAIISDGDSCRDAYAFWIGMWSQDSQSVVE